jgi:PleD family two-component response regulator
MPGRERRFAKPASSQHTVEPYMMPLDHSRLPLVVLVVEDEMMLRMKVVDMVEDAGYIPVEAVDADEAMAILQSRSDITAHRRADARQHERPATGARGP